MRFCSRVKGSQGSVNDAVPLVSHTHAWLPSFLPVFEQIGVILPTAVAASSRHLVATSNEVRFSSRARVRRHSCGCEMSCCGDMSAHTQLVIRQPFEAKASAKEEDPDSFLMGTHKDSTNAIMVTKSTGKPFDNVPHGHHCCSALATGLGSRRDSLFASSSPSISRVLAVFEY